MPREEHNSPKQNKKSKNKKVCPQCQKNDTIRRGKRKTNRGLVQRYFCQKCKQSFIEKDHWYKTQHNPEIILMAVDQYFQGHSSRTVKKNLKKYFGITVDHETVLEWVRDYHKYLPQNKDIKLSGIFYGDETVIKVKGVEHYFWASIDHKTRYVMASHFSRTRTMKDTLEFMQQMKEHNLKVFQTDSMMAYPNAFKKLFGMNRYFAKSKGINPPIHRQLNYDKDGKHNVRIERFFREFKMRYRTMVGFKNKESAKNILKSYVVWHNHTRQHQAINKIPSRL